MEGELSYFNITNIEINQLAIRLNAYLKEFPLSFACYMTCLDQKWTNKLQALIGDSINGEIKTQLQNLNGPLFVDLQGKNGSLTIDGELSKGVLLLKKDLQAQVVVTPNLGRYVLEEIIPILNGITYAEKPLQLTFRHQGFSTPIEEMDFSKISIDKASLNGQSSNFLRKLNWLRSKPSFFIR